MHLPPNGGIIDEHVDVKYNIGVDSFFYFLEVLLVLYIVKHAATNNPPERRN